MPPVGVLHAKELPYSSTPVTHPLRRECEGVRGRPLGPPVGWTNRLREIGGMV